MRRQDILKLSTEVESALTMMLAARDKLRSIDEEISFSGNLFTNFSKIHKELSDHKASLKEEWEASS